MKIIAFIVFLMAFHKVAVSQQFFYSVDYESRKCIVWKHTLDLKTNTVLDTVWGCQDCAALGKYVYLIRINYKSIDGLPIISISKLEYRKKRFVETERFDYQTKKRINFNKVNLLFHGNNFVINELSDQSCERKVKFKIAIHEINNKSLSGIGL